MKKHWGRRRFLKQSALGVLGASAVAKSSFSGSGKQTGENAIGAGPKVKDFRTLGRTGFKVTELAAGYGPDEGVLAAALDAGINYIDTAEQYPGHHQIVSKAIKGRDRKSIFISSKIQVLEDKTKEGFLKRARKCLEDLDTEYIDCMMMHMPEKVETLATEGFHAAMEQLKAEGRIKHVGVSNHGSFWFQDPEETMDKVLLAAAEDGRFDVFLLAYNFLLMDKAEKVLDACHEKKIGTALMKTTPITKFYVIKARVDQMKKEGKEVHPLYKEGLVRYQEKLERAEAFIKKYDLQNPEEIKDAAVRFVLDNPKVNTVCCSAKTFDELDKFISLSGSRLSEWDNTRLAAYRAGCGELYCRHACGECEPACPQGVPVNTILRYSHYFTAQGREQEAMVNYAAIPGSVADVCAQCPGFCEQVCHYNVPVQGMLLLAHANLSVGSNRLG